MKSNLLSNTRRLSQPGNPAWEGFSLVETLIAMFIMTFGLMAASQMIYVAMSSGSLARSKGNAAMVAQDKIEVLGDLYRQTPHATDLADGNHGPEQVEILNPENNGALNRFNVAWTVSSVSDPRAGKILKAKKILVTVTPIGSGTISNNQVGMNKVVNVASIFSDKSI